MSAEFYYALQNERKRLSSDEFLDSETFEFMQNFASEIEELAVAASASADFCLSVLRGSLEDAAKPSNPKGIRGDA